MKNLFIALFIAATTATFAQETGRLLPQITVQGEGKVKVVPDQAFISVSVDTRGNKSSEVKKQNDEAVEKVVRAIRNSKLAKEDVQTRRVALNPIYDYEKKKYSYAATQTIEILLRDLSYYDQLMENLVNAGINRISNVEFRSSKMEQHEAEARRAAMRNARSKADDYVSVLNQKVGKAIMITDNSQVYYPQPMYAMAMDKSADASMARETLAVGEINITANVTAAFLLD